VVLAFAKLQKATVNYTIPAHLCKELGCQYTGVNEILYKICQKNSGLVIIFKKNYFV
jgi:hypothetical protein